MSRPSVLVVLGTRPDAIKLAPVILELQSDYSPLRPLVCNTGQHRDMVVPVLNWFGVQSDLTLDTMQPGQSLAQLTARLLGQLAPLLVGERRPDAVIVQGDTTTAFAASLTAFYARVPVAHVEAGLRTGNLQSPFPEELNRRAISLTARHHFTPTPSSSQALMHEGIPEANIHTVGNTVVDALRLTRHRLGNETSLGASHRPHRILITAHRRESFGAPLEEMCRAIRDLADRNPSVEITFPVHLNPNVRDPISRWLGDHRRVRLLQPVAYQDFVQLMLQSDLILTDSGGIQEEAAALGKPTLIMRETTERPEVLSAGTAMLVGAQHRSILAAAENLLNDATTYRAMSRPSSVFGDGFAARRIVQVLVSELVLPVVS